MFPELLLYLMPGVICCTLFYKKQDALHFVGYSLGLGFLFHILLTFFSLVTGLTDWYPFLVIVFCLALLFVVSLSRKKIYFQRIHWKDFLVLILLLAGSLAIFKVHYAYSGFVQDAHTPPFYLTVDEKHYPYPLHADEWGHLALATQIVETKSLGYANPFYLERVFHLDLEEGYHLFLASLSFSGIGLLAFYQYLPALFFFVNGIFLFLFMRKCFNETIALFSVLFFFVIPSNTNLLGHWYAVPLTFSLYLLFLFWSEVLVAKTTLDWWVAGVILAFMIFIYPFFGLWSVVILAVVLMERGMIRTCSWKCRIALLSVAIFGFVIILLMDFVFFDQSWSAFQYPYGWSFFGIVPLVCGVIGAVRAVMQKKFSFLVCCIFAVNILLFQFFRFGLFFSQERSVFFLCVGLALLAGIGAGWIVSLVKLPWVIFGLLVIVLCFRYYVIDEKELVVLYLVGDEDISALHFVDDHYPGKQVVLADNLVSLVVYPLTHDAVVATQAANLAKGERDAFNRFYLSSCDDRWNMLQLWNVSLVVSRQPLSCPYLLQVYDKGSNVYEVGGSP